MDKSFADVLTSPCCSVEPWTELKRANAWLAKPALTSHTAQRGSAFFLRNTQRGCAESSWDHQKQRALGASWAAVLTPGPLCSRKACTALHVHCRAPLANGAF